MRMSLPAQLQGPTHAPICRVVRCKVLMSFKGHGGGGGGGAPAPAPAASLSLFGKRQTESERKEMPRERPLRTQTLQPSSLQSIN